MNMKNEQSIIKSFPTSWDEVKLKYGKDIFSINTSGMTDNEYLEVILTIFEIDHKNLTIETVLILKNKILDLLKTTPKSDFNEEYTIGGIKYKLKTDLKQLTGGEFIDLEMILNNGKEPFENLPSILGILLKKQILKKRSIFGKNEFVDEEYNPDTVFTNAKIFENNLTVNDIYGFVSFFFQQGVLYSNLFLSFLEEQMKTKLN